MSALGRADSEGCADQLRTRARHVEGFLRVGEAGGVRLLELSYYFRRAANYEYVSGNAEMSTTRHEMRCLDVLHAASAKDLKRQMVAFSQELGFETVGALVVTRHSRTLVELQSLTNAPEAYLAEFHNEQHSMIDPVAAHWTHLSTPIVWDRKTYVARGVDALWEIQAPFGYKSGIAVAMHLPRSRYFVFGANWREDHCTDVRNFKSIAEDLLSFAAYAQAAAFELSLPTKPDPGNALSLTKGEREALRWTMDGLTDWEIGRKMALSSYDVTLRLHRAMRKLGCGSKYEAVLRAIKSGLIAAP